MATLTKYCLFLAGCLALASCSTDRTGENDNPESPYLLNISVSRAQYATSGTDLDSDADLKTEPEPKPEIDYDKPQPYDGVAGHEEIFKTKFVPNVSHLFVSQNTNSVNPFESDNKIYNYVYFNNQYANWESGFNFEAYNPDNLTDASLNLNALNWETVRANGSVGNGFALYALYYHNKSEYPDDRWARRSVALDQSTLDGLRSSDILGAYHSTSSLYSRVRFKLHHMMVYFKINLYVPVYGKTVKDDEEQNPSGYTRGSLKEAIMVDVVPGFTIDWSAGISSEGCPVISLDPKIRPDGSENTDEEFRCNISLYSHAHEGDEMIDETAPPATTPEQPGDDSGSGNQGDNQGGGDENQGEGGDNQGGGDDVTDPENPGNDPEVDDTPASNIRPVKKTQIDIKNFLPSDMINMQPIGPADEGGHIYDDVYLFSFSVIVPAQDQSYYSNTFPGFLKFSFKHPTGIENLAKNYYFSSGFSANSTSGSFSATQSGSLQVLNLYLPRKGDEVVLIGANIQDWTDVDTDMNLPQKEPDKTFGGGDDDDDDDEEEEEEEEEEETTDDQTTEGEDTEPVE